MTPRSLDHFVSILGAGLAGSEAAYQCAKRGIRVELWEQRPATQTEAHQTGDFAELVCSNSLKSKEPTNAHGLLKAELQLLDSLLLRIAEETAIPGGKALVVDRRLFARRVTEEISHLPGVTVRRESATALPVRETGLAAPSDSPSSIVNRQSSIVIVTTGPLTSEPLATELSSFLGSDNLAFYDAISPIVSADSVDRGRSFAANRYIAGDDYLNCPLTESEYDAFYDALVSAQLHPAHEFELVSEGAREQESKGLASSQCRLQNESSIVNRKSSILPFEGCLPIEDLARRGKQALLFGPMKPVGLIDPATGQTPFAVVQLRRENLEGTMYNLVGFQTRMTQGEQRRVLGMIPALARAEYLRYGSVHRNTFINAPLCLKPTLQTQKRDTLLIAGQLSGVEGYVESIATGLFAGINAARLVSGQQALTAPEETMLGGLLRYITTPRKHFQPMNANFGLLPVPKGKRADRPRLYCERSLEVMKALLVSVAG